MASLLSDENRKIVEEGYDSYIETKKRWYMDPLVLEGKTAPMTLIGKDIADVKLANEKIEQAFEVLETLSLAAQKRPEEYPYRDEKFSYKEQPYEVVGYDDGDEMNVVKNLKTGKMEPLMTALTEREEEQFRNMLNRINKIFWEISHLRGVIIPPTSVQRVF